MYALAEYAAPCKPTMAGWDGSSLFGVGTWNGEGLFGLGAALTPAQRKTAALAKRTQRKAVAAQKKAVRIANRTVHTSKPELVSGVARSIQLAQSKFQPAYKAALAQLDKNRALMRARKKVDVVGTQRVLADLSSAGKVLQAINAPVTPPVAAKVNRLRGMGYMGTCMDSGAGDGSMVDDQTGQQCDPATGLPYGDTSTGGGYPQQPAYQQPGVYQGTTSPYGVSPTGLVPGFGLPQFGASPFGTFGSGGYAPRGCSTGSNLPRCLIYQMAVDEQQQFQFVFSILQQMYAQLLQIVQQLLAQLQSAQQQPYGAYGQSPYAQSPYGPYGDPNNPYGSTYGGAYPGPGYPGAPYYPGGADSSAIPPGYGDSGGDPFGAGGAIPGDITQVFPGPGPMQQGPFAQGPSQPTNIISSDSLPDGADTTVSDTFGGGDQGFVPAYTPAPQSSQPLPVQSQPAGQSVTSGPTTPTVIVLQQGPGQSSYADTGLPAGPSQDQPSLEPPTLGVEDWARES